MVQEGFYNFLNWFDERAWYPLGRIVGGTVSGRGDAGRGGATLGGATLGGVSLTRCCYFFVESTRRQNLCPSTTRDEGVVHFMCVPTSCASRDICWRVKEWRDIETPSELSPACGKPEHLSRYTNQ